MHELNLIEKSKPIVWAKFKEFNVQELKLIDTYLSKIDARNVDSATVRFTKAEYCRLMGLHPRTPVEHLKKYTRRLVENSVELSLVNKDEYKQYNLFAYASCEYDKELGQNVIELTCNYYLKDLFFNIASDGYIKYRLRNIINLHSRYSMQLYCFLKDKAFGNYEWIINVDELKELLGAIEPMYDSFKYFNLHVLSKAKKEINENTDIRFDYEKIMQGRKVKAIKFKIRQLNENNLPGQMNIYDFAEALPESTAAEPEPAPILDRNLGIVNEACNETLSEIQCEELFHLTQAHLPDYLTGESRAAALYTYVREKYLAMKNKEGVKNEYRLLRDMIKNDYD